MGCADALDPTPPRVRMARQTPKLKDTLFESVVIQRYRAHESSVEKTL